MVGPTIHPFRKSTTPIPSDILHRICTFGPKADFQSTLANIALTCQRAYDVVIPILYRRLVLTNENADQIFYGLPTFRSEEARRFERYFSYSDGHAPVNAASRLRKIRALSHVRTLQVDTIPSLKICKRLHILDSRLDADDRKGIDKLHLLPNCRHLVVNVPRKIEPSPLASFSQWTYPDERTKFFVTTISSLVHIRSTHLCVKTQSEWLAKLMDLCPDLREIQTEDENEEAEDDEDKKSNAGENGDASTRDPDALTSYASITCHGDELLGRVYAPTMRFFLPKTRDSTSSRGNALNSLQWQLELLDELRTAEEETDDSSPTDTVEFIGGGRWYGYKSVEDAREGSDMEWNEDVAEVSLNDIVKLWMIGSGWDETAQGAVILTKAGEGEACVCCGGS